MHQKVGARTGEGILALSKSASNSLICAKTGWNFYLTCMENLDSKTRAGHAYVTLVKLFVSSSDTGITAGTDEETQVARLETNGTSQPGNPYLPPWVFHTSYKTQTAFVFESGKNSFIREGEEPTQCDSLGRREEECQLSSPRS